MFFAIAGDRFFWFSDLEFARETLAGANPHSIQLVKA
jgi:lipoxygenase